MSAYDAQDEPDDQEEQGEPETPAEPAKGDPSGLDGGWIMTHPDKKQVRKFVVELFRRAGDSRKKRVAKEERWERVRGGERGLRVVRAQNSDYIVRSGWDGDGAAVGNNKPDQLIRRIAATLTTDPPLPTVGGSSSDEEERQSSQLAERLLRVEGKPANRDDASWLADSIDAAGTYASAIALYEVDPQGDGLHPMEIQAFREATNVEDALTPRGPAIVLPDGTSQPGPLLELDPSALTNRYVTTDNKLTDIASEARCTWRVGIARSLLRPSQVEFLPAGADGYNAHGVLYAQVLTLGQVIARYYDGVRPKEDDVRKLVAWKFDGSTELESLVPKALRDAVKADPPTYPSDTSDKKITEDAFVAILTLVYTSHTGAPFGARVVVGGLDEPIVREEWRKLIGEGEKARWEYLPLPTVQLRWRKDPEGDPFGVAGVEDLANDANMAAQMMDYVLTHVHRAGNPFTILPIGTTVQPGQLENRDRRAIFVPQDGKWEFEQAPALDPAIPEMLDRSEKSMQDASGLNSATATGEAPASVTSGTQMQLLVEETRVGLSNLVHATERYIVGCWSLLLVFARAYYDTPRELDMGGEGADTQQRALMGIDLLGAADIEITKGTGTQMSPTAKAQSAREELQLANTLGDRFGAERYHRAIAGNQSALLGIEDDPHRARIDRQIGVWRDAARKKQPPPPPAPMPALDLGASLPGMPAPNAPDMPASLDGAPAPAAAPAAPAPVDPVVQQAAQIFKANPTDDMPDVATIRYLALSNLLASSVYQGADVRYQQAANTEFLRMKQAAGVLTIAEQQQAQAAQAAAQQKAQQDAATAQENARSQADAIKSQSMQQQQAAAHGADMQKAAQAHAFKLEEHAQQSALTPTQPVS